jgi:hypothetical protein
MAAHNREWEASCKVVLIAVVAAACISAIPLITGAVSGAIAQSRGDAAALRFACRSCGVIEDVHEVELGLTAYNVSTVSGEAVALMLGMLTGRLGTAPAKILEVAVRLQDGSVRIFHEAKSSGWMTGDRVKIRMGKISSTS